MIMRGCPRSLQFKTYVRDGLTLDCVSRRIGLVNRPFEPNSRHKAPLINVEYWFRFIIPDHLYELLTQKDPCRSGKGLFV